MARQSAHFAVCAVVFPPGIVYNSECIHLLKGNCPHYMDVERILGLIAAALALAAQVYARVAEKYSEQHKAAFCTRTTERVFAVAAPVLAAVWLALSLSSGRVEPLDALLNAAVAALMLRPALLRPMISLAFKLGLARAERSDILIVDAKTLESLARARVAVLRADDLIKHGQPVPSATLAIQSIKEELGYFVLFSQYDEAKTKQYAALLDANEYYHSLSAQSAVHALKSVRNNWGRTIFAGDGVTDCALLSSADVGLAYNDGSDGCAVCADALISGGILSVPLAVYIAKGALTAARLCVALCCALTLTIAALCLFQALPAWICAALYAALLALGIPRRSSSKVKRERT